MRYDQMPGPAVPRRGNRFSQWLGAVFLRLLGWRITGQFPDVPKAVIIGAPHTSNWDGVLAVAAVLALRLRIVLMGKHSLFKGPFAPLLRWLGLIPIDRSSAAGVVEQSVSRFHEREQMFLGMAPEGTRHSAKEWKTGFYRIACDAGVPIMLAVLDYGKREIRLPLTFMPSGDLDADMEKILACYRGVLPRRPERLSLPLREDNAE